MKMLKNIKKISLILFVVFLLADIVEAKTITINSIPNSVKEFVALRNQIAKTPEGGAAMFIIAMMKYSKDQQLGEKFFTIALSRYNISKGNVYKGYRPARHLNYHLSRLKKNPHWPFIYVQGAKPDNGYAVSAPYTFKMKRNKYSGSESSGKVKVFVYCYGASPRPMVLKRNNRGYWKARNVSSFWMGSVRPTQHVDDDL